MTDITGTSLQSLPSRRAVLTCAAVGVVTAGSARADTATRWRRSPSLVLLNGDIRLLDRRSTAVEAVAVRDGRVVDVGRTRDVRRSIGRRTRVLDLDGRTAIPGVNDSHVHGSLGELVVEGGDEQERVRQVNDIVRLAHRAGFQVGTHATGDRTIAVVTAAYVRAIRSGRRHRDPRHYTIHSDPASDAALARQARFGLGANMNPSIKTLIARRDGRRAGTGPRRQAVADAQRARCRRDPDVGVRLAGHLSGLARRRGRGSPPEGPGRGNVSGPEQRLTIEEALPCREQHGRPHVVCPWPYLLLHPCPRAARGPRVTSRRVSAGWL